MEKYFVFFSKFSARAKGMAFLVLLFAPLFVACQSVPEAEDSFNPATSTSQVSSAQASSVATSAQVKTPATKTPEKVTEISFAGKVKDALVSGDMDAALALFENMPKEFESDTGLQLVHASILVSAGRIDDAKKITTALEKADSNNIDVLEMNLAIATASNDARAQRTAMQKILAVDPNNAAANIRQAEEFALARRYRQAGDSYRKVLSRDNKNVDALFGYAQMMYYLNDLKQAQSSLTQLLEIEPDNGYALAYMGKLYAEDENYLRASQYINKAVETDPTNYDFYLDKGTYERYLGHSDAAMEAWTKCISLNPNYFLAYVYRAGLYGERSNFSKALSDYQNVVRLNPNYYFAYEEIGALEWHEKNWAASRKAFQTALTYSANNYAYILMIAATYLKENNRNEMRNYLGKAMRSFSNDTLEYQMMRMYYDNGPANTENNVTNHVNREQNTTKRGRMRFYLGLYFDLKNSTKLSEEFYVQVTSMAAPLFFEYRLAEWGLGK